MMTTTNDDPPEFPEEISTSPQKAKLVVSLLQPCRAKKAKLGDSLPPCRVLEELLYEIFLRLPVKSLIRFRCLSKGMRRLIDSPIFIRNHNTHRSVIIERDRDRSLSVSVESDDEDYAIVLCQPYLRRLFSLNFDKDDDNNLNLNLNLNLNRGKAIELNSSFAQEGKMEVMGRCCNGIFCFKNVYGDPTSYVFWNPSNGTFRKVDCSARLIPSHYYYASSMGYDCINDDYKILRFIVSSETTSLGIYSFREDSWRRKIPVKDRYWDLPLGRYCYTSEVCLGGVIHWLWTKPTDDKSMSIAAFDLATETFTSLDLPLEARQLQLQPSHFTDFRGRLCITFLPAGYPRYRHGPQAMTIWVMDKYGVESCWSKLYNFGITGRGIRNFYFPNMKRRLLINSKWLSWWDPQDGSFEDIEIPGLLNEQALIPDVYYYQAYVYVRNLLRLDRTPLV